MISKKIIIIGTTASNLYGFRKDFILSCLAQNYHVYAFLSEYSNEWLAKIESLCLTLVTYILRRGVLNSLADLSSTYQLIKKIKEIHPDIVFSYSTKPVIYATLAAYKTKVPYIDGMIE